jgi:hypothetical protein
MRQTGSNAYLAQESLGTNRDADVLPEDLDRNLPLVLALLSEMDHGHSAAAQDALDRVPIGEDLPEGFVHRTAEYSRKKSLI